MDVQKHRQRQVRALTNQPGVYALCDLDGVPIYVGKSVKGIKERVQRHLTSARSDVIANRQIDVWEVAFVWAWPVERSYINAVEAHLFREFDAQSTLMNGQVPGHVEGDFPELVKSELQVLTDDEIARRKQPLHRFPRQAAQVASLLDYILETTDKEHLRRSLHAHFTRLQRYYESFQGNRLATYDLNVSG